MAVKKTAPVKKAALPKKKLVPDPKRTTAAAVKTAKKNKVSKGDIYICGLCGLAVSIDRCGRAGVSELLCCGKVMKQKAVKAKSPAEAVKLARVVKTAKPVKSASKKK